MKLRIARAIVRQRAFWMLIFAVLSVLAAISMGRTRVNYDLISYLAEDTETKRSLNLMNGEFTPTAAMSVILIDSDQEETEAIARQIRGMEGVTIATHDAREGLKHLDGHSYRLISVITDSDHGESVLDQTEALVEHIPHLINGNAKSDRKLRDSITQEMPIVLIVSCAIVFVILLLMTRSFLEPFIFFIVIAVSILLNMGSNFLFESISFITFAVTAILQLALAMDYSIMLMNAFDRLRDEKLPPHEAMAQALSNTFMPITSSAMTTVAGMLALVFMSFTIGFDIGMVLAKGIVTSMLTVFLLLPGLLVAAAPVLEKTAHAPLHVNGASIIRLSSAAHGALPILLIALIVFCATIQRKNVFVYTARETSAESRQISILFGQSNQLVLLFPRDDSDAGIDRQQQLIARVGQVMLEGRPVLQKAMAMSTTGEAAVTYYDAASAARMLGRSEGEIQSAFNILNIQPPIRGDELLARMNELMSAISFLMPEEAILQLEESNSLLQTANMAFNGPHYSRILLSLDMENFNPEAHRVLSEIRTALRDIFSPDTSMTGMMLALDEIDQSFARDTRRVSLITIAFVFIIVLLSFRSLLIPVVLVCVIQGAIWINMSFSNWYDGNIFFMCYLICMALQMGATIDYGILLTNHYRNLRSELPPREAAGAAIRLSLHTILTSGLSLAVAGFAIGVVSTVFYIASIGTMLGRGTLVSITLILLLLPQLLQWLDRLIVKQPKAKE